MRPLVVLGLVLVAGATLLFALFSLGGEEPPTEGLAVGTTTPEARPDPGPAGPVKVNAVEDTEARPSQRQVPPRTSERETLGSKREVFEGVLAGVVTAPDGSPVGGAKMTLVPGSATPGLADIQRMLGRKDDEGSRATTTDGQGRYRFANLEPGNYTLVARHADYSRHEDPLVRVGEVGESFWDVQLDFGLEVFGHVRDSKGAPVAGARLHLNSFIVATLFAQGQRRNFDPGETATTDDEGVYRFTNVTPGQWNLTAHARGFGRETKRNLNLNTKNAPVEIDFELTQGAAISGRVYAPDRSAIAGALVTVIGYQQPQTLHAEATTDASGNFQVPDLMPGKYVLMADAEGWGRERVNHVEAPDNAVAIEMTEQGSVMGFVVSSDEGAPIPSFKASLHQYVAQSGTFGRALQEHTFDSADGSFTLTGVPEGRYGVQIHASGFATAFSEDFDVTQGLATTDVVVRLGRGGSIVGQVIDQSTGKPVAGATVETRDNNFQDNPLIRMFGSAMPRKTSPRKARTDKDGRFEITLLTPELYQVNVTHPNYPNLSMNNIRVAEGTPTDVGSMRLTPGGTIRGTVFDESGSPLPGSTVQLVSAQGDRMEHFEVRTGRDGRYLMGNIPAGIFKITATRPTTNEDPFRAIRDMKHSEVQISISRGQEYTQDLYLGG